MPEVVTVAEALKTALAGATFSKPLTVKRVYLPDFEKQKDTATVYVMPRNEDVEDETTRGTLARHTLKLFLVVYLPNVKGNSLTQCDEAIALAGEVLAYVRTNRTMASARFVSATSQSAYDPQVLDESGALLRVWELEYTLINNNVGG